MDRQILFAGLKGGLIRGRLTAGQVEGVGSILDAYEQRFAPGHPRALAYILATAHHETARRLAPGRETLATSDGGAIAALDRAFAAGRLRHVRRPYWRRDAEGHSWFGRGFVQLTHRENYARLGTRLGVDLLSDPGRAMEPEIAAAILCIGMVEGLFTGRRLDEFLGAGRADWTGARAIVNGADGAAARIAASARLVHAVLLQAGMSQAEDTGET